MFSYSLLANSSPLSPLYGVAVLWSAHVCVSCPALTHSGSALLDRGNRERAETEKRQSLSLSLTLLHIHTLTHTHSHPSQGSTNSRAPDSTPNPPFLPHSSHTTPPRTLPELTLILKIPLFLYIDNTNLLHISFFLFPLSPLLSC